MNYHELVACFLTKRYANVYRNPNRRKLIFDAVECGCARVLPNGTLVTWTSVESSGRSPKDTFIVRRPESEGYVDWTSPNCIPLEPETFDMLVTDALACLQGKMRVYVLDRLVGADPSYCLPIQVLTDDALGAVFIDNMFRPLVPESSGSIFADRPFLLISVPHDAPDPDRFAGRLRKLSDGSTSTMAVVMDMDNRVGLVYGSSYMGSMKKLIFTVMNYLLPPRGILPLHCSANEGTDGSSALLLGLSGTGKTTLSSDPERKLLGDDEHAWSGNGIANFEYGCYPKLINLNPEKEPEIYRAVFHADDYLSHGSLVENLMVYPDGSYDLADTRLTPNSRASFPLRYFTNIKESACAGHPKTVLFLTADAWGVLPPISKLTLEQAMFWFIMGYTSKLAGTETGIIEPEATFSRFFGQPFMPRHPSEYISLLRDKIREHNASVYLVNTGWVGGSYGVGKRIDISLTRSIVRAALDGKLEDVRTRPDAHFNVGIPERCPGAPAELLVPVNMWNDTCAFETAAKKLAAQFREHFDKAFAGRVEPAVAAECPVP